MQELPLRWTYKQLKDPYSDTYVDLYEGSWSGATERTGFVPLLDAGGKLLEGQMPDGFATIELVRQIVESMTEASGPTLLGPEFQRIVRHQFPIFAARVAVARTLRDPVAVVVAGSSTTAANPGYVGGLSKHLQTAYFAEVQSVPQWNKDARFTARTLPGLHVYSAGLDGARSHTYMTAEKRERVAALNPALIHHMVGANDFSGNVPVETYKANMIAVLEAFDTLLTEPCQHTLWQPYQRAASAPIAPWEAYGDALREIAESRADTVFVDISAPFITNGIPGADPLALISADLIHLSTPGYAFMTDIVSSEYLS